MNAFIFLGETLSDDVGTVIDYCSTFKDQLSNVQEDAQEEMSGLRSFISSLNQEIHELQKKNSTLEQFLHQLQTTKHVQKSPSLTESVMSDSRSRDPVGSQTTIGIKSSKTEDARSNSQSILTKDSSVILLDQLSNQEPAALQQMAPVLLDMIRSQKRALEQKIEASFESLDRKADIESQDSIDTESVDTSSSIDSSSLRHNSRLAFERARADRLHVKLTQLNAANVRLRSKLSK